LNLEAAVEFVRSRGNIVEQARLKYLLDHERPSREAVNNLLAGQRPDGGWPPFWAPDSSSLDATCFRLAQAEQIGLTRSEIAIAHAVQFLTQRQQPDGSWEEDKSLVEVAPVWARPGDLSARLYLTANCGFWLAVCGETNEQVLQAAAYLQAYLDENGHLPASWQANWLASGLWWRLNWKNPAQKVMNHLTQKLSELPASNLAWLVITLINARVPASHILVDTAASSLEQSQVQLDVGQAKMVLRGMCMRHLKFCEHCVFVGASDWGVIAGAIR
jgi:hypothetical protein